MLKSLKIIKKNKIKKYFVFVLEGEKTKWTYFKDQYRIKASPK